MKPRPRLKRISETAASLFSVEGPIVLLAILVVYFDLGGELPEITYYYPFLVLVAGLIVARRYGTSRLLFGIILLTLADRSIWYASESLPQPAADRLFQSVVLLLPVNFLAFSWMDERGTVTRAGRVGLIALLVQAGVVALVTLTIGAGVPSLFDLGPLKDSWLTWTRLSQPALAAYSIALIVLTARLVLRPNATGRGYLWSMVAVVLAVHLPQVETFFFATAGLVLIVSVREAAFVVAHRDHLTGLLTRRSLDQALLHLGDRFSVAMIDVDHLKNFNDRYGHDVGDQVLRKVAGVLDHVGGGGKAYRYGGEEFTILFADSNIDAVKPHLETIRETVERVPFVIRAKDRPANKPGVGEKKREGSSEKVPLTVSVGAAQKESGVISPKAVIGEADMALYDAKHAGRNCVRIRAPGF